MHFLHALTLFSNIHNVLRNLSWNDAFKWATAILRFVTYYFSTASRVTALDSVLATCQFINYNLLSIRFNKKTAVIRWVLRRHFLSDIQIGPRAMWKTRRTKVLSRAVFIGRMPLKEYTCISKARINLCVCNVWAEPELTPSLRRLCSRYYPKTPYT